MPFNPINYFKNKWQKKRLRKQEIYADQQYLDAIEVIKATGEAYLNLLAHANENNDKEACARLEKKINTSFEFFIKTWNGDLKITHNIVSNCYVIINSKRLSLANSE